MFNGQAYNESVDVYSYAMCLVEIFTCKLPWDGVPRAQVPVRVCKGERPQVQGELTDLIKECWEQEAARRPSFERITQMLEETGLAGSE